ncbi:hypothetical protein EGT49_05740 [Companilactobacillus suantsaicola]|uniref:WxL domain-containing protein n=1 Tax=Companilactobacillus suantsaicola TaxID=2487723 RepID=A0A4Z0JKF4_9LACO|nr:WxL domain-containing protein [Companilactobacillus suantsaicola]TGD23552.1 hypothetical protein EGT49_05740 [Companilactobacillus suantsaicola]
MKSFNKIIRILALASLAVATTPLTQVKAAESADAITVQNGFSSGSSTTGSASSSDTTDAITYSANDAADSKTSTVTVTVLSGILTLDAVPDFNFGTMSKGTTVKLKNNTADTDGFTTDSDTGANNAGIDGNSDGYLQVTDSRNLTDPSKMPGFQLSASIGKLNIASNETSESLDAILHLSALNLVDDENNNVTNSDTLLKTKAVDISSVDGNDQTVIDMKSGTYNPGVIRAKYNTPDAASLTIPNDGTGSTKSSKNMNAVVTWTLTASPSVTN